MPIVTYSALRLALFAACLGLLYWAQLGGWLLIVGAAFVAWAASYVMLARPRDAAARYLAERAARRKASGQRFARSVEEDAAAEDALVDAAESASREAASHVDSAVVEPAVVEPAQRDEDRAI